MKIILDDTQLLREKTKMKKMLFVNLHHLQIRVRAHRPQVQTVIVHNEPTLGHPQKHYVTVDETDDDDVFEDTPPQQQYLENRRNELNRHPRELKNTQSYYASPVYTDESGIGISISDTDLTFTKMEPRRKRNYIVCQSSSSTSNSRINPKKGRKRTKNPSQWKQNKTFA